MLAMLMIVGEDAHGMEAKIFGKDRRLTNHWYEAVDQMRTEDGCDGDGDGNSNEMERKMEMEMEMEMNMDMEMEMKLFHCEERNSGTID